MTTISDLCDVYGISRSTALRRVKDCFGDAPRRGKAVHLDASQTQVFADYMAKQTASVTRHDAPSDASPTHHAERPQDPLETPTVRALVAQYEARIRDLQDEVERLHAALEREQQTHVGFWHRLGQRLLGDGK